MQWRSSEGRGLRLVVGDITRVPADAIVNAANSGLRGGGGVDGAIHRAGGPSIMCALDQIRAQTGGCATGSAVATPAGNLPALYVFHAVGPVYRDGKHREPELLASCYRTCLEMANKHELATISFPSLSTGAYGYPQQQAAKIAVHEVVEHLKRKDSKVREVIFVLFDEKAYKAHAAALSVEAESRQGCASDTGGSS